MMKITIVTHDTEGEIRVLFPNYQNAPFQLLNENRSISVIRKAKSSDEGQLAEISANNTEGNILLFHLSMQQFKNWLSPKFDIGTKGANAELEGSDRWYYEKLLNANKNGIFDWTVFDEVWEHFSKKNNSIFLERNKTDFLYHIYNGGKPSTFKRKADISTFEKVKFLYENFEKEAYDKQKDLDSDKSKGAEQRQKLSLLRDALLNNK